METQQISSDSPKALTAIDRALAAARARAAQRAAATPQSEAPEAEAVAKPKAEKQPKVKDEAAEEARAARKAQRDAERAARREAKAAAEAGKASHMKKVERAAAKLPKLSSAAAEVFRVASGDLNGVELTALAAHLQHHVRATATVAARGKRPEVGASVRIVGGDPKFFGMVGTVVDSRPLRCFVEVTGVKKPVYLFNSEVEAAE